MNENQYIISLILPVYNGEAYIKQCLESVISQTIFDKLQVIVINDGSTDSTEKIISFYNEYYSNIVCLNISNCGVSGARNIGIRHAKGLYIAFVDADDWIDSWCYEKMLQNAMKTGADIVAAGIIINKSKSSQSIRKVTKSNYVEDNISSLKNFLRGELDVQLQDKLFRTSIVKKILFDEKVSIGEDRLFILDFLFKAKKISYMKEAFYHYYQNEQSVMHREISSEIIRCVDYVANQIKKRCEVYSYDLLPYAEAMYISDICRLYCSLYQQRKKNNLFTKYKQEIKCYSLKKAIHYMSIKHFVALFIAKVNPILYNILRGNTYLRFMK